MHSLKNTVVAVLLLGVSYGVYEVLTTPDSTLSSDESLVEPLVISDGSELVEAAPQPHIQLPNALEHSSHPSPQAPPPSSRQSMPSSAQSSAPIYQAPVVDAIVPRQPKMDFSNDLDIDRESGITNSPVDQPHDHELIAALQHHLEPQLDNDAQSFESKIGAVPDSQMVSTTARPESASSEVDSVPSIAPPSVKEDVDNDFATAWGSVEKMTEQGQFRTALETLTRYYNDSRLTSEQQQKLMEWLDALAGKVIYSSEHHLAPEPYMIQANESLSEIASRWNVTEQLVVNVNQSAIPDSAHLTPGTELKVIMGPFHGELNISKKVLTVFVDNLYAGRFTIENVNAEKMKEGRYHVISKSQQPTMDDHGTYRIELEGGYNIHGGNGPANAQHSGGVSLSEKDAADLFSIFTEKSLVFIK